MSKIICFNVPLYGHINPTRELEKGLVEHGETVIYYSEEQFKCIIYRWELLCICLLLDLLENHF